MSNPVNDKLNTLFPEQVANLYKKVFGTEEGKLVLQDLNNRCFVDISTNTGNQIDNNINEGMRCVVLHINTQIIYKEPEPEKEPE